MSNPYPIPAKAFTIEDANEHLRAMLAAECMARIDARVTWGELAKAIVADDKPGVKRLMLALLDHLNDRKDGLT